MSVYNRFVSSQLLAAKPHGDLTETTSELVMVPANTGLSHWYIWNVVTSHFTETSLLKALLALPMLALFAARLEKSWGPKGLAVFLVMHAGITGVISSLTMLFMYMRSEKYFFDTVLCGPAGLIVGVMLASVRADEGATLLQTKLPVRLAVLPGLVGYTLFWYIVEQVLKLDMVHDALFAWVSFVVGFWLARNYDFTAKDALYTVKTVYADDPYCFDAFFPESTRPVVRTATILVERVLFLLFGRCLSRPAARQPNTAPLSVPRATGAVSVASNPTADRRRARALKALDQKLAQINREPEISLDEGEEASRANGRESEEGGPSCLKEGEDMV
mmetsp:Transcript_90/g.132  ORF Transcript_90/g.132 Transcript_90/m.132 type:complete len:332 (+) Transcript_90:3-998(+)